MKLKNQAHSSYESAPIFFDGRRHSALLFTTYYFSVNLPLSQSRESRSGHGDEEALPFYKDLSYTDFHASEPRVISYYYCPCRYPCGGFCVSCKLGCEDQALEARP